MYKYPKSFKFALLVYHIVSYLYLMHEFICVSLCLYIIFSYPCIQMSYFSKSFLYWHSFLYGIVTVLRIHVYSLHAAELSKEAILDYKYLNMNNLCPVNLLKNVAMQLSSI